MRRSCLRQFAKIALLMVIFAGIALWQSAYWLPYFYIFLDVGEKPQRADAIIVLGGVRQRAAHAAYLYNQGFAKYVLVGGSDATQEDYANILVEHGVPLTAIVHTSSSNSTWQEVEHALDGLADIDSVLVVTSGAHLRRTRAVFHKQVGDSDLEMLFINADDTVTMRTSWWNTRWDRSSVLWEYPKLLYYMIRYGVWIF